MNESQRLTPDDTVLLVIDLQEKLLPAIAGADEIEKAACRLIKAARILGLPIILTEQYPAGLGHTTPTVRDALGPEQPVEKLVFSACVPPVQQRLSELNRHAALVVGIETHVCVQQTVLDLLPEQFRTYVCADATGSRRPLDHQTALERMRHAGAIVTTTESAIFELLGQAGTDAFKQVLKIVK